MNVLSLFDGLGGTRVALDNLGIKCNYFASEIDKYAIKVANHNYSDITQLGDINHWKEWDVDFGSINLISAGFPCQSWSISGKQKGDKDVRGALVHVLVEICQEIKRLNPNVLFLFENVKMKKEFIEYLNKLFGCEPILIDSALLTAQRRKRLYWTNIPDIGQPEDKGILLKDIIHEYVDFSMQSPKWCKWWKENAQFQLDKKYSSFDPEKAITMTARQYANWNGNFLFEKLNEYMVPFDKTLQILDKEVQSGKVGFFRKDSQANRVYYIHNKAVTLCGEAGGGPQKWGNISWVA